MLIIVNWFVNKFSDEEKEVTREDKRRIVAQFNEWLPHILAIPKVQTIVTFDQLITFFETERPANLTVNKGVILRQEHSEGQILGQIFLDQHNQIICRKDGTPYGRQLVAKNLDKKLIDCLGNRDLIVVKLTDQELPGYRFNHDILTQFGKLLPDFRKLPQVIPVMTYDEAIQYFVSDRPNDPKIKRGAILRKPHLQGYHIVQMFLDQNNELVCDPAGKPYGQELVAIQLDEELLRYFGGKNVIIVE